MARFRRSVFVSVIGFLGAAVLVGQSTLPVPEAYGGRESSIRRRRNSSG